MVDSRQKGARAELAARDLLRSHTGLNWERIPSSGALNEKHGLKGDLYIPQCNNKFCVEVKHYKDDHLTSKILTSKSPQLIDWWTQAIREAEQVQKQPLLLFKFDRSKWFIATDCHGFKDLSPTPDKYKYIEYEYSLGKFHTIYIAKLEDWLKNEEIEWILKT